MRKAIAILAVVVMIGGCAGTFKWSDSAQTKLNDITAWAETWIGGALDQAPVLIAAAVAIGGQNDKTDMATEALKAAKLALAGWKAAVAVGSTDTTEKYTALLDAINKVKATVGEVKALVDMAGTVEYSDPTLWIGGLSGGTVNHISLLDMWWTTAAIHSAN